MKQRIIIKRGRSFGPFSQFRIDLYQEGDEHIAVGFDAGAPDGKGLATAFLEVRGRDCGTTLTNCHARLVKTEQWREANYRADGLFQMEQAS